MLSIFDGGCFALIFPVDVVWRQIFQDVVHHKSDVPEVVLEKWREFSLRRQGKICMV